MGAFWLPGGPTLLLGSSANYSNHIRGLERLGCDVTVDTINPATEELTPAA